MATVEEHYDRLLADVYSWMYGGWDAALARYTEFFAEQGITPSKSARAVDLGAGCGFQAIPLARLGFSVTAIDIDRKLLAELQAHAGGANIETVCADLVDFRRHTQQPVELVVCMVDTLLHLASQDVVEHLFDDVLTALEPGGTFIATFRDFSVAAEELDRFISVRSDRHTIFTCFLEFEPATVRFMILSIGASMATGNSPRAITASCGSRRRGWCRRCARSASRRWRRHSIEGLVVVTATK